jgi:cyclic pyranopterin phosphate synthase
MVDIETVGLTRVACTSLRRCPLPLDVQRLAQRLPMDLGVDLHPSTLARQHKKREATARPMALQDALKRPLQDLRISVTDRCNFRCRYCMPREHFGSEHVFLPKSDILTYEEITRVTASILPLGLRKLRITGGEPLVRRDISHLIGLLRGLDSNIDIALTTNGILLAEHASDLKEAGLNRVTVSLDALETSVFQAMGDTRETPSNVVQGIDKAIQVGLTVKVNTVVQRGINEDQVTKIAGMCFERGITPRFIEFMDVGSTNQWDLASVVSGSEIRAMLSSAFGPLEALPADHPSDVAKKWTTKDGHRVGLIQSVTAPFCGDCSRARISANGSIYTCLFASEGKDLLGMLRFGATEKELREAIQSIWLGRSDRYSELRTKETKTASKVEMSFIGG